MKSEPLTQKEVKEIVAGLNKMARNLWWTWNNEAQEIFESLSPRTWQNQYHNAVAVLREVSEWNAYELRARLQNPHFAQKVKAVLKKFDNYMTSQDTWAAANAPQLQNNPVAYFSAEFGFHESLPIAAGGLGMLAGDHTKSASDLGLGFVGITLFYRDGYFQQTINNDNWQVEYYPQLNPRNLAMEPVLKSDGDPLLCEVDIMGQPVFFRAWKTMVGRSTLFLLDTNVEQNSGNLREITARVYGGDVTTRIMQEIVLGIGGVR
ncbi:MAG: alpha-glucan family phosphorylase, partial [Verrucomicrobia bacterium]|nr:alpha-glucan family phosphorylase [Verrucomicrobiota bacterium]